MSGPTSSPPAEWTREYAERVVEDFLRSGMTVDDFAQKRGFSKQRVAWLQREAKRRKPSTTLRIVELVPAELPIVEPTEVAPRPVEDHHAGRVQVLCPSGHTVLVGGDLTAALTATFRALREGAC